MSNVDEKKHVVAKEFKTVNRCFSINDPVSEDDIHPEGHLSFEDWKKRGFVAEVKAKPAPPQIATKASAPIDERSA